MDFNTIIHQLMVHFDWMHGVLLALLLGNEYMGSNEKVKASSYSGIIKALFGTLIDQVKAQKAADTTTPPSA